MNIINQPNPAAPPVIIAGENEKCPSCGKDENKKVLCRNCGYEYESENDLSGFDYLFLTLFIVAIIYFVLTIATWFMESSGGTTFWDVIKSQYEWVKNLRLW